MAITLDKFRAKLVVRILYAGSIAEAERFILAAVKAMQKAKVNMELILRFVENVFNQLAVVSASGVAAAKAKNIEAARLLLQRIKDSIGSPASSFKLADQ